MRIKVMDADGGHPVTLTTTGVSMAPAWSPDGTVIAYAYTAAQNTGRKLWLMNADGTNQRAFTTGPDHTDESIPTWSPDGRRVAFTSSREGGKYRIWVINADGSNPVPLTTASYDTALQADIEQKVPAWQPSGFTNGRIVCSERLDDRGESQIISFAPDGHDPVYLTEGGSNIMPSWSRDGRRILFSSNRRDRRRTEIWVMDADGSGQRQLTFDTAGGNFTPVESPDGSRIAFSGQRGNEPPEVWVMNGDGSHQRQLTQTPRLSSQPYAWSLHPTWSADGKRIAYASTTSGSRQIWMMNADGSDQHQLTFGLGPGYPDANVPSWSYNGAWITFWSGLERQYGEVWIMQPDGAGARRITETLDPGNSDDPQWSPDGRYLVFGRNEGGGRSMCLVEVATGAVRPLANGVHWCAWQPLP